MFTFVKTVKLFISQPMHGMDDSTILKQRGALKELFEIYLNSIPQRVCNFRVKLIDQFNLPDKVLETLRIEKKEGTSRRLYLLGRSIQLMGEADVVLFYGDWNHANGCRVEYEACNAYGIDYLTYAKLMIFVREEHPEYRDKFGWLFPYPNPTVDGVESDDGDDDDDQYEGDLSVYADSLTEEPEQNEWKYDLEEWLSDNVLDNNYNRADINLICEKVDVIDRLLCSEGFIREKGWTPYFADSSVMCYESTLDDRHGTCIDISVFPEMKDDGSIITTIQIDFSEGYKCDEGHTGYDEWNTIFTECYDIELGSLNTSFSHSETKQTKYQDHLIPFNDLMPRIKSIVDKIEEALS